MVGFACVQSPDTVNNAQMASIPSHPIWLQFANIIQNKAAAGERQPLLVAGPTALTALLRVGAGAAACSGCYRTVAAAAVYC